ncbi:MAG: 3-hydroxyacyl-CoA dehydrogenase NAD-binding domain-containing protein [Bacteroidota bacterium]
MIKYSKDTNNIVTITLDMKNRNFNVINHEIFAAFVPVVKRLQKEKAMGVLKGVILTSAKKTFLSGGDLEYLYNATNPVEIFNFCQELKSFLRDLEGPGVPVVAAINGSATGAGYEVALACHHRIAIENPNTAIGLSEVKMGIIPAGGGIIRLMWLLGVEKAYQILTKGHEYTPKDAHAVGLIDELATDQKDMIKKAKEWLLESHDGRRPWDRSDCKIPGGTAQDTAVAKIIRNFAAQLSQTTHNNYPAPQAILNVLSEGSKMDFDTACRIESRYYTKLICAPECKNMIKAFWFDNNSIQRGANRPKGFGKFRARKVGVIGAGQMGTGIATACIEQGLNVVLKDVSHLIAERGREMVAGKIQNKINAGILHPSAKERLLNKLVTTADASMFQDCDIVIEAVFENRMVKQKVTKEAENHLDEYSIFATNTVSIPITKLAEASLRPDNYVGLHFFHPAEEVPLVEIIRGANTSDETIARAFDFVRGIDRTPIIVKDDWGFFAARVQNTYILEGITMLQEGYPPALIENLGLKAGMRRSPLYLADALGFKLVLSYEMQAAEHYGPKYIQHPAAPVLKRMLSEFERSGRPKKTGFYDLKATGDMQLWTELPEAFPQKKITYDHQEIIDRLLIAQVLEATWCLQEKVIHTVEGANLGSIYGWGFPSFKGGVIQYVNDYGYEAFIARCKELQEKHGQRFQVPKILKKLV